MAGVVIDLEDGCTGEGCRRMALRIGDGMVPDFTEGLAIQPIPADIDEWQSGHDKRQVRSRCNRAERLGYYFSSLQPRLYSADIIAINRSMPERQGRPMAEHYLDPAWATKLAPAPVCPKHHLYWYGVFHNHRLFAYAAWYRVGELLQTNIWIGHGDYTADGIMYYLMRESLREQYDAVGPGYAMYHYYDAGGIAWNGGGLRQWKKQLGFEKMNAVWV